MKLLSETLLGRMLDKLATAVTRHRQMFLWPQFLLFGICAVYTVIHFRVDMNRDNLVGGNQSYHEYFLKYKKEFPAQDDLVVVVESENMEKNRQFVERLGKKLEAETNIFTDVFYKGDLSMMGRKALLFAHEGDLREMQKTLANFLPFIQQFTHATNLDSLFNLVNSMVYHAKREANASNDALLKALPMLTRIVNQGTASLERPGAPPSPGIFALFGAGDEAEQQIYITFRNGRLYLVTARARTEALNDTAVERLRDLVAHTAREVPGLNVGITGEPILDHDEMVQSQKDSTMASIISLIICALIFIYGYQETGRPLKATLCLLIGLGYTMAFTMLVVGHLNILTITFVPILIGLAIDFGVHLITRYEEELRLGQSEAAAIRKAMVFTGQGIITGAMTTAVAFLAMCLTDFKGIKEMGIICGGGMLLCLIPMLTMLPVLLFRGRQNVMDHTPAARLQATTEAFNFRSRVENIWLSRPITVTVVTVIFFCLALGQLHKVYFDYDLQHMQSAGLPAVVFEQKLIHSTPQSVLFGAVVADSLPEALKLEARLAKLPAVSTNISMAPFLSGDATEKLKLIHAIKQEISRVRFEPPDRAPVRPAELSRILYSTEGYMGAAADEVRRTAKVSVPAGPETAGAANPTALQTNIAAADAELLAQLTGLKNAINEFRKQMLNLDAAEASEKLAAYQQALFGDVNDTFDAIQQQDDSSPLQVKDLPGPLRNRFVGISGKYLIQVYPKEDIWQHDKQAEFVRELRSVDPNVTGTPVQLLEYTSLLKDSYIQAAYYALAAIALMVLIHFRNFYFLILALLPVGIGVVWMCGLMGAMDIPFNPANIMTLPLVIGIGVTNGIHILNRFVEEGNAGIFSKSTGKAVFVSGLTAIAGFGSLILAKHQGIRSLGEIMSLGVALCMAAGLTFVPAMLILTKLRQTAPTKQPSGDNARSTLGREEPR